MYTKILTIILILICCSTIAIAVEQMYKCDLCGFYHNAEDTYFRTERNPNHLQSSWTSNVNFVCKYCINRLNYLEKNLFKQNCKQRSLTYEH